ncbi:hypothetical protein PR202_ga28593 [Eleusine coracana subsp. coracana]|uniref:Uncharacterized protein n=1 Tax=Eleusine coracana subsp. coracana TaxID=191504 RepID=A0AAV5DKR3_ELECO|nr:hypothetical protein PR202_ga28593 [Eleusine coracana subsp. coracana]
MAETALSVARSILGSAISKAAAAAAEEMSLLMGVQKEIWFMKDELKTMQAFLIASEKMKRKKPLLKVWAEQVRSLSYDIEDCLDEFMVHVGSRSLSQQLMKLKDRHRIGVQIRNLKSRVEEVSSRNTRYNLIEMEDIDIDEAHSSMEDVRSHSASNIDEEELVGFETPKQVLLDMINTRDNDGHAQVICVVGMGGLGKTTLVRKIYESKEDIAMNFSCFAWITVSQSFSKIDMLKDMIVKFLGHTSLMKRLKELEGKGVQVEDLASYLREQLKEKRYFIVLDDLWDISDCVRNKVIAELHMAYSKCWSETGGVKVPRGIGNLKELQTVEVVSIKRTSIKAIKELGELSKLRKLSVITRGAAKKKCMTLCKAIQKLSSLRSLWIDARGQSVEWIDSISSPLLLRSLTFRGRIEDKVDWFGNLTWLLKLCLVWTELKEGKAMEILGALPNLMLLHLLEIAYAGEELVFRPDTFLNLREFHIRRAIKLREIRFEQDASPQMESIEITDCILELGINGIKHLPKLKEISLSYKSEVAMQYKLQDEMKAHPNQPVLRRHQD